MATLSSLLGERLARQGLGTRSGASVFEAASVTTAIQAQDNQASRLGLRARAPHVTETDVVAAVETERTVVRTWLLRGTIHLVDTRDLRWLVRLVGPSVERRYRTRWRQLGLHDDYLDATLAALPQILADGPLNRHEIAAALVERGVVVDAADPQRHTHVVLHASTTGLLCRGPDRGRHSTFALTDRWVPDAPEGPSGDDALAELARRYFAAFSPATAADFATWSGLGSGRAIGLIHDELTPCDVDGSPGYRLGEAQGVRGVRLLPAFDNYLLGYKDRSAILAPDRQARVYRGGMITPTLVVDGVVRGTWALDRTRKPAAITVSPFDPLTRAQVAALEAEVADLARFLGRDAELRLGEPG
jgi:hypothetical protein